VFLRFNHFLNLLGYNPGGKEGPDKATRQEGYLFWLAWLNHSATALFSNSDANGVFRPVTRLRYAATAFRYANIGTSSTRTTRRDRTPPCAISSRRCSTTPCMLIAGATLRSGVISAAVSIRALSPPLPRGTGRR